MYVHLSRPLCLFVTAIIMAVGPAILAADSNTVKEKLGDLRGVFIKLLHERHDLDERQAEAIWERDLPRIMKMLPSFVADARKREYTDDLTSRWVCTVWAEYRGTVAKRDDLSNLRAFGRDFAYVKFTSEPDGADVTVDGTEMLKTTPCEGFVKVMDGHSTIRVKHDPDYEEIQDKRELDPNATNEFSYRLKKSKSKRRID